MWIYFSLLSGFLYTLQGLLSRFILKGNKDAWAFSFYFSAVGALTSIPFVIFQPKFSSNLYMWALMILVGILIVVQNLLNFKSTNHLEASLQGSITKFRLIWVLIIGVIFLNESLNLYKVLGTVLTVVAGLAVVYKSKELRIKKGMLYAFLATIVYAVVIGLYKVLFSDFNSATLTFLIFLIPAILNLIVMPNSISRIVLMAKEDGKNVFLATFLGGFANLAMNHSLSLGEASQSLVVIEAFLIIVLVGEHFILKERKNLFRKVVSVMLATAGAVLIRLSN
ncbi:DMT family transporter [Patescibacteria group bacterium]|nr:DMT family transporter [Patescibacteria group bacterium]